MPETPRWRDRIGSALEAAAANTGDPRAHQMANRAVRAVSAGADRMDAARRGITQEDAWSEVTATVNELVDVVVMQQRLIDRLIERVNLLETSSAETL